MLYLMFLLKTQNLILYYKKFKNIVKKQDFCSKNDTI